MDEYFCPNCGATLNDQYGFDPDNGTWTCTECGTHLMDDDGYDGDVFEGVAWHCDCCGALLNRQPGFSDNYDCWTCTECYHSNPINENEIYESEEDYQNNKNNSSEDEIICPNCGADLNQQYGFSNYDNDWECTDCGVSLHRDYYDEPFEEVEYDEDEDDDGSDDYETVTDNQNTYTTSMNFHPSAHSQTTVRKSDGKLPEKELRKQRIKAFLFKRKKIQIKYGYTDLLGKDFKEVEKLLYNQAFNNIKMIAITDIYVGSSYYVGQVEQVVISGSSYFVVGDHIPYDAEIIITYHIKRQITIPFSERELRKLNYGTVINKLKELGFTEIYEKPIKDLITGWIKKDGTVEKVTIGKTYPFKRNSVYPYDVKITIEYHTFKNKK